MANLVLLNDADILQTYGFRLVGEVIVDPPKARRKTVKVPGGDGVVDYSLLYGKPIFDNRDVKFSVFSPYDATFSQRRKDLFLAFHGQRVKLKFNYENDPVESQYYYEGVLEFAKPRSPGSTIYPVTVDADPYKYKNLVNTSGSGNAIIAGTNESKYPALIEIAVTDDATLKFTSYITQATKTVSIGAGLYSTIDLYLLGLRIDQGAFSVTINGLGDYTAKVIERTL